MTLPSGETVALAFLALTELALVRGDGTIRVWDVTGRREVRQVPCPVKAKGPWQLSPDGKVLAASQGHNEPRLYLWEWQTSKPVRTIVGPECGFTHIKFSPDGRVSALTHRTISHRVGFGMLPPASCADAC